MAEFIEPKSEAGSGRTLGDLLDNIDFEVPEGTVSLFGNMALLARLQAGASRDKLTSNTLLFALGFAASSRLGNNLQQLLTDDLSSDFSGLVQDAPDFEPAFAAAFDVTALDDLIKRYPTDTGARFEEARRLSLTSNLARILDYAITVAHQLNSKLLLAEHLLIGLIGTRGSHGQGILEKIGLPRDYLTRRLILHLPRSKTGTAGDEWTAMLNLAGELPENKSSRQRTTKKASRKKASKKKTSKKAGKQRVSKSQSPGSGDVGDFDAADKTSHDFGLESIAAAMNEPADGIIVLAKSVVGRPYWLRKEDADADDTAVHDARGLSQK